MTNKELENKIAEKFVSIMRKLCGFVVGHFIQDCSPYFKTLIMACVKMTTIEKIKIPMSSDECQTTNKMFRYFDIPEGIYIIGGKTYEDTIQKQFDENLKMLEVLNKDNRKLERIYNLLDKIDILLGAKDFYDKMQTIGELAQQLDNEYKENKND